MDQTNCQDVLNIETISFAFRSNEPKLSDQIISCLYSSYQSLFVKWAKITYQHYPPDMLEFAANNSFTDAVLKLKEAAARNELYQSNASVKTILWHYCRNILLGYLKNENRLAEKNKKLQICLSDQTEYGTVETEYEAAEIRRERVMRALSKMSAADRQIIQWRHIDEKSNDEIARFLAITVASATNRIYRCMQRLRELVDDEGEQNN